MTAKPQRAAIRTRYLLQSPPRAGSLLLEGRYAGCERITLVVDNLNTHTKGAFYTAFKPSRARDLVRRIEFCYTPKDGSWLNIAENELNAKTRIIPI